MTSRPKESFNLVDLFPDFVDLAEDFGLPVFNDLEVFIAEVLLFDFPLYFDLLSKTLNLTVSTGLGSDPLHGGGSHPADGILLLDGIKGPRFTPDIVVLFRVIRVVSFKLAQVEDW